jgi:uncharacterized membrane protein (UPF0182 family)
MKICLQIPKQIIYFVSQSTFMSEQQQSLEDLQHIKRMMERSGRFISLSGLSGVMAGLCALAGAWFAHDIIVSSGGPSGMSRIYRRDYDLDTVQEFMGSKLFMIAILTFISALVLAFLFTYLRSKKSEVPMWGTASRRLLVAVAVPMIAGGFYLLREIQIGNYGLIAPGSLIFYGLALVNASKFTLGEIKYLGYCQIILGIINCWVIGYGLYFWAIGFGVLHIIYGIGMWYKYERK